MASIACSRAFRSGAALSRSSLTLHWTKSSRQMIETRSFCLSTTRGAKNARTDPSLRFEYPKDGVSAFDPEHGIDLKRTLPTFTLEKKVAVVTGGAGGLGLVMAKGLIDSGADVAIIDLASVSDTAAIEDEAAKSANSLVEVFASENPDAERLPKVTAHYADVSDPKSVASVVAEIVKDHGKIDNLITSAGFTENFDAVSYPHDRVQKLFGVNFDGTWLFATEIAKHLQARKAPGSFVFIGSMSSSIVNVPQPQAPYNASKAAVRHLAASLAVEWASHGIRVNCISPGYMLTALTKKILAENPKLKEKWVSMIPQGKMGDPEDLMGPVVFLCSEASGYVTGAELRVDGGYTTI